MRAWAPSLLLASAMALGAAWAFAAPVVGAAAAPSSSASAATPAPIAPASSATVASTRSGLSPMPSGSAIPKSFLPPGAPWPDPGPSLAIYPPQKLAIRFNHKLHVQGQKLGCTICHERAKDSTLASDRLVPSKHGACSDCHAIDEAKPEKADSPPARCDVCHLNVQIVAGVAKVPAVVLPAPNLKFNHKAHAAKGIGCAECHGNVGELELATRDQLPRMKGCFDCHQSSEAGGLLGKMKGAKSACTTCHLQEKDGTLRTMFASGAMLPPRWMKNAQHGSDWIERHKKIAGVESGFCGNCHTEKSCDSCHNGSTKPHSVHPNDWMSIHPVSARFDSPKCSSCHSTSSFCTPCHTRAGLSPGLSSVGATARFHPPATVWSATKRMAGDHGSEAQKNINACVSCHVERDCVSCHGSAKIGAGGFDPHGPGFKCSSAFAKNPRPCFVCHLPGDSKLLACK